MNYTQKLDKFQKQIAAETGLSIEAVIRMWDSLEYYGIIDYDIVKEVLQDV